MPDTIIIVGQEPLTAILGIKCFILPIYRDASSSNCDIPSCRSVKLPHYSLHHLLLLLTCTSRFCLFRQLSATQVSWPKSPMPFRRESKVANVAQAKIPANLRSYVQSDSKAVYPSTAQPRPRSSWYSQPSISESELVPVPPMPAADLHPSSMQNNMSPLTSGALKSFEEALLEAAREQKSGRDDDEGQSPKASSGPGTPNRYMSRQQHTAVSEYLHNRAWSSETPRYLSGDPNTINAPRPVRHATPNPKMPATPPPAPPTSAAFTASSIFRRFSISSSHTGSRRGSRRRSESVSPVTESLPTLERIDRTESSSKQLRSPLSMLKKRLEQTPTDRSTIQHELQSPLSASAIPSREEQLPVLRPTVLSLGSRADQTYSRLVATPYENMRQGPAPIMIQSLPEHMKHDTADATTFKPTSSTSQYNKRSIPLSMPAASTYAYPAHSAQPLARNISLRTSPSTVPPPSYHSRAQELLRPHLMARAAAPSYLHTKTRDPYSCSDQGSWLAIGTMRGPTPDAVRAMDQMMSRAVEKGRPEKGVKEIQKVLRHERRTVIEWVEDFLTRRWGVDA